MEKNNRKRKRELKFAWFEMQIGCLLLSQQPTCLLHVARKTLAIETTNFLCNFFCCLCYYLLQLYFSAWIQSAEVLQNQFYYGGRKFELRRRQMHFWSCQTEILSGLKPYKSSIFGSALESILICLTQRRIKLICLNRMRQTLSLVVSVYSLNNWCTCLCLLPLNTSQSKSISLLQR